MELCAERTYVTVRRSPRDWRRAKYLLENVSDLRWSYITGGVQTLTARKFLYGRVVCDKMAEGELAHSCTHGEGPHEIKVCILKTDNSRQVYNLLADQATG